MKSIQTKLTVTILIIFVVAMGTLGGLNYWKARQIISDSLTKEITTLTVNSAGDVSDWIDGHKLEIAGIGLAPVLQTGNFENIGAFLQDASQSNGRYETLGYIAPNGMAIDSKGTQVDLGAREYFKRAMQGESVISDPVISPTTGGLVSLVAVPVKSGGKVTGVFFGSVSLNEISQKVAEVKIGKTGYAYMLRGDGLTIANADQSLVMKDNPLKNEKLPPALRKTAERMVQGEAGTTT